MTIAICIFCGAEKFGALVPCESCGGMPNHNADEMARAMACSDNILNEKGLDFVAEKIKLGEDPLNIIPGLKQYYDNQYESFSDAQGNIDYEKLRANVLNSLKQQQEGKASPRARLDKNKSEFE